MSPANSTRSFFTFAATILLAGTVTVDGPQTARAEVSTVSGIVRFDGPQPSPQPIEMHEKEGKLSECHHLHKQGLTAENLIVGEQGELANAFVYVKKGYAKKKYAVPDEPAVLNQVGCMFRPRVQGVMIGQNFVMQNSDPLLHNVRTLSFKNRPFNVAQAAKSPDRIKIFDRKEKAVMIQCDLHPWMKAWCFVMDHPWFAVTDATGRFRIEGLPTGDYTLAAWHEELGEQDVQVRVGTTGAPGIEFVFMPKKSNVVIAKLNIAGPRSAVPANTWSSQRPFVRHWNAKELAADAADLTKRSIPRGREVYRIAGCIQCHVSEGQGARFGPDLAEVAKRFQGAKLLAQILEPSSEIHKDHQVQIFVTDDGRVVSGIVVKDDPKVIHVVSNPLSPAEVAIVQKSSIEERHISKVSLMPDGLLDTFSRDEILNLLAFVQSRSTQEESELPKTPHR